MGEGPRHTVFGKALESLVCIAIGWTHDATYSEDLAQRALVDAWQKDPEERDRRALVRRAAKIMKGLLSNDRRANKLRVDTAWLSGAAEASRGMRRTPEQLLSVHERKARLFDRLIEELATDVDALALVEEMRKGGLEPAEQADALVWDYERVRNTRKRVARAVEALATDHEPDSARGWDEGAPGSEEEDGDAEGTPGDEAES